MAQSTSFDPSTSLIRGMEASFLNNRALELSYSGDHEGAERLHRRALAIKNEAFGPNSLDAALSRNALGESQLQLGKLDEAEENLTVAVDIRNSFDFNGLDAAVSRENLAQVYEAQGKLRDAQEMRASGRPSAVCCSNPVCTGEVFRMEALKACSRCKCAFYCSVDCQKKDWSKRHKAFCRDAGLD